MYFCTMCGVQRGERITITDFLSKEEVNQIRKDKAYIKGDWNVFVQEMYITKVLKIMQHVGGKENGSRVYVKRIKN